MLNPEQIKAIKARVDKIIQEHNRGGAWRIYGLDYNGEYVALLSMTGEDGGAQCYVQRDQEELWAGLAISIAEWERDTDPNKETLMEIVVEGAFYDGGMRFSMING